jgi:hypothetical protein
MIPDKIQLNYILSNINKNIIPLRMAFKIYIPAQTIDVA